MEEYYSTRQLAKMLTLKTVTIRRWIVKGELPAILLGKEYRVTKTDLDKFLADRKTSKRSQK